MRSSFELLYQPCQQLFADGAIKAESPVPEGYLAGQIEGFRLMRRRGRLIGRFGFSIQRYRK